MIELLVVIGIIAILAGVVIVALNPGRQFAQARNTQRWSNVNTILNAISQNMSDNKGTFVCTTTGGGALPATSTEMGTAGYNIEGCISPTYVSVMPTDPVAGTATNTNYYVLYSSTTRRVTISAPQAELGEAITVTR